MTHDKTMHMLEDIESVLNFFEDGEDATSSSHSPVEGFAGHHLDDIPVPVPVPVPVTVDGPFRELNWATPEDGHFFLHGLDFLDHPIADGHWVMHGLEDHQSTATASTSVENGREKGGGGIGIDPKAEEEEEVSERWVHGKSRSKRIRRVWPLQALPARKCCSHCKAEKTPQWRMGPLGPKTLCNACGVRYKSGRLVPEYRPAASPTFVAHLHSNSHRKIMRMREQRNN